MTGKSFINIFEEQVLKTPANIAVVFQGQQLDYQQLNEQANQLAHLLQSNGVRTDTLVPLYMEGGIQMIVAMLGIMKAGGAYVPIDTDFPQERISYMLADTGASIIVSSEISRAKLPAGINIITPELARHQSTDNLSTPVLPSQLAYVIYTSGSTGNPKGVMIEQGNLVDYIDGLISKTSISQCQSFALVSTIATDLGNTVIYGALATGGALHVFTKESVSNIEFLHSYFNSHSIDCLKIVPSHWKVLNLDDALLLPKKLLVFGGEALQEKIVEDIRTTGTACTIINHYGPTETTIGKLLHIVEPGAKYEYTVPIGKPFSNTKVLVLTKNLKLCPIGVPGQLYITGDGLARGYWNNPELTNEKFIPNPFSKQGHARMYGTGDLVKYLPDGSIAFIGRADNQVKIRGYRIELGEIENVILQCELVSQAVVLANDDKQGNKRLVGYIVPENYFDKDGIIAYLEEKLPDYMIPSLWVEMEAFPLTANGKIDRNALPDPATIASAENQYVAPRNEIESRLAAIWQDVLEVDQVGINDDFFELGGHSLLAVRLVSAIRKAFSVEMPIGDIFDYPTVALLSAQIPNQSDITVLPTIQAINPRPQRIPLSFSQERLWFMDQLSGSQLYHVPAVLRLKGQLDKEALANALQTIINRHEVLRTVILEEAGSGYQQVKETDGWQLQEVDGAAFTEDAAALRQYTRQLIDQPFNLSADHMLRATLINLAANEYILVVTLHHIASDAWSTAIIVNELVELYNAAIENRSPVLPTLPIQYADYASWQRSYLQGEVLADKIAYWKSKLESVPALQLPTDFTRPAIQSTRGALASFRLDQSISEQLQSLSQQEGTTIFMTLLAAYNVLLYRYTGQQDICVGTPVAGRQQTETEGLVGFFINTLALRTELDGHSSFKEILQQVRQTTLDAYAHQEIPFEKVVEAVVKERDLGRSPLFQVLMVLQNAPIAGEVKLGDVQLSREDADTLTHDTSKYDLTFTFTETAKGLILLVEYCTDLFSEATIQKMAGHFSLLLNAIVAAPGEAIGMLPMLTEPEQEELLLTFNDNDTEYPKHASIVEVFRQQAENYPANIALAFEEQELSYRELDERSNQLAHYLVKRGLKENMMVPVCIERGIDLMVAIIAILKAGGTYVPIDPEYPAERIGFMLEDIKASLLVSSSESSHHFDQFDIDTIEVDNDQPFIDTQSASKITIPSLNADSLAYVIYTSGSTGKPKGVMVTHRNVVSLVKNVDYVQLDSNSILLSTGSSSFDATTFEYWGMLLNGGRLVLCNENKLLDIDLLKQEIEARQIDTMWFTAGWFNQLVDTDITVFQPLSTILAGGEKLSEQHVEKIRRTYPSIQLLNGYGPTENTTFSLVYDITETEIAQPLPIGRPLSNRKAYILNEFQQLVPVGVSGEICLGGTGLSQGYLNQPALTAAQFVPHPFSNDKNEKIYKTGDQGKWLPDGSIAYLGRIDQQVKVRGFRIELGEIESVLLQHENISQAVVLAKEDKEGHKKLVGYVVTKEDFDKEAIMGFLKAKLPDYMVPAIWVQMDGLPLTRNGKVDKNALPDPDVAVLAAGQYIAPRNEMEQKLAAIWQDLLGLDQVGIEDNFFELGGDSIVSIQLVSRIKNAGYQLQVADIFTCQTIGSLADVIVQRMGDQVLVHGEQEQLVGYSGLLPIQKWFFEKEQAAIHHFNQAVLLSIDKKVSIPVLQKVTSQLMSYHDALRFKYTQRDGRWMQEYGDYSGEVLTVDLRDTPVESLPQLITEQADAFQRKLDINKGELLKMVWMQTPVEETSNRLLIVIHHLATDGVSWRILLEDIDRLINESLTNLTDDLGPKTSSYRQWYHALEQYGNSAELMAQLPYWQQAANAYQSLPVDMQYTEPVMIKDRQRQLVKLPESHTRLLLRELPKVYHTEINDILLAALAQTVADWSGNFSVAIGLEGHGRENIDTSIDTTRTVGWFTALYPVMLKLESTNSIDGLIKSVKEQLRLVPTKGIGYGVLKYIKQEPTLQGDETWDIVFNYLGQLDNTARETRWLKLAGESTGSSTSEEALVTEKFSVNAFVQAGELVISWSYSSRHFASDTIQQLADSYLLNLQQMIDHCVAQQQQGTKIFTPADFGLAGVIEHKELDQFLDSALSNGQTKRATIEQLYRLSGLQQGMLFHGLYDGAAGAYTNQLACELGGLNLEIFIQVWEQILQQHSILRSAFYPDQFSLPLQAVYNKVALPLEVHDLRQLTPEEQAKSIQEFAINDKAKGFDFTIAPLMRIGLLQIADNRYRMFWTMHHILFDGWSLQLLMEEFLTGYESLAAGKPLIVGKPDQYQDYIHYIEQENKEQEKAYWQHYLQNQETGSLLPFIDTITERNKGVGEYRSQFLQLDTGTTADINRFAQSQRITVNTIVQGVWALLLHHYTVSENIVYGATVSGRPDDLANVERRVGMFINTLPLHASFSQPQQIGAWLKSIQEEQVASRRYQYTPLQQIQGWTGIQGDLFDSIVVFENYPVSEVVAAKQWSLQVEKVQSTEETNYPLSIFIHSGAEINVRFSYNSRLLRPAYVEAIAAHFENVLLQLIKDPAAIATGINLITAAERHQQLFQFNDTAVPYLQYKSITHLFEQQVQQTPEAVAILFEGEELAYTELNQQANQLAHYLAARGIGEGILVPICIKRSPEMLVGILGILKTGAAFVPVDPDYPVDRINYMLEDTAAKLVISSDESKLKLRGVPGLEIILIDEDWPAIEQQPVHNLSIVISPNSLAYTIHTSGSTGMPKGVMIEHGSVVNLIKSVERLVSFDSAATFLSVTTFSFDICYLEFFVPLTNGGKLVLVPRDTAIDGYRLVEAIRYYQPTHMQATPATWQMLLDAGWQNAEQLKILIGGEAVKEDIKDSLTGIGEVYNMYGPTETTIWSVCKKLDRNEKVLIGQPMDNTTVYIVNEAMELVPAGVTGEICIGGAGLARGYLNRPDLTEQKFIDHPFAEEAGLKIYRTGDIGRWLPDGNMECLGRMDDQVKIRGYRIELGEIETVLMESDLVNQAVVLAKEDKGNKRLVGYYVPRWQVVKAKEQELYHDQVESWKEIYETEYASGEATGDEEFDINIWKDSFTGNAIPAEQMQEWLQDIVQVILSRPAGTVLEIGSGTGLVFYQLAGKIDKYIGTDFSRSSVELINQRIKKGLRDYGPTELMVAAAHEVSLPASTQVNTIVLNSIVQYFPGEQYINEVMEKCMSLLSGPGRIIIGDVRDNRLLAAFKGRLQLQNMVHSVSTREFKWAVDQELLKEEELCFNPEYFYRLATIYPAIQHVEIVWKEASNINELSLYRYNVVLYIGDGIEAQRPGWQDWKDSNTRRIVQQQIEDNSAIIAIKNVPSVRLWQEQLLNKALDEKLLNNVGELVNFINREDVETTEVKKLLELARSKGYHSKLLVNDDPMKVDIVLELEKSSMLFARPVQQSAGETTVTYTNVPLFSDISLSLQKDLKAALKQRLPEYMVPSELVALGQLPLTNNGKIDRRFLSQREEKAVLNKMNFQAPTTEIEQTLAIIWQDLLGIDQVGIYDNFFELGGHSLLAMRLVSAIRKQLQMETAIKTLFTNPTIASLAAYLQTHNNSLLLPPIEAGVRPALIPLSFSQERLWFIDRLEGSIPYHIPAVLRLKGKLNETALAYALQQIVNRHEVLRTLILENEAGPYQQVLPQDEFALSVLDISNDVQDADDLQATIQQFINQPFNLAEDHKLRSYLIRLRETEHLLVVTMHHIASDGWSISVIVKEVIEFYNAFNEGRSVQLNPLKVQYADYAIWQRKYLIGEVLELNTRYWKQQLEGVAPLQLPTDFNRPAIQSTRGGAVNFNLDKELSDSLQAFGQQQGATMFMTMLAAIKVLLYRYSGQQDICVGSPIAGRSHQEVEDLIGFFINTIALRSTVKGSSSFTALLQQVKDTTLEAYAHQELPFEKVVEVVVKERDLSRSPLFQVMFILQNTPEVPVFKLGDVELVNEASGQSTSKYDLTFNMAQSERGLQGTIEYCTDLFTEQTIFRMIGHLKELLKGIIEAPRQKVEALPLLGQVEEEQLLVSFNNTAHAYPQKTIHVLFEEQVLQAPAGIALVLGSVQLTYAELNERSNQLAHYLLSKGIQAETLVPVCIERGPEMIVALLGILKAGATYVPVDPEYPEDRIQYMLEDTAASIVISSSHSKSKLPVASELDIVLMEADWPVISQHPATNPAIPVAPEQLAYVIYTSGSTGKPKGVMIAHTSVVNLLISVAAETGFTACSSFMAVTTFSFDIAYLEIYLPLITGGKLVLVARDTAMDGFRLAKDIALYKPSHLQATPSTWQLLLDAEWQNKEGIKMLVGGEAVKEDLKNALTERGQVWNVYGPTETTIWSTIQQLDSRQRVLIGKPVYNTNIQVLSAQGQLVPVGVTGEILIGGVGLARGYYNRPELTAEKFIANKYGPADSILYRTGDLGRWLPGGLLECFGRIDEQVKIRGYRIELGEIETVLQQSEFVKQSVVVVRDDTAGNKRLVGYIVPGANYDKTAMIAFLQSRLPEYMVPALWMEMEALPLTPNGKINKKALPDPVAVSLADSYISPSGPTETSLAAIWQQLLGVQRVSIHDNFFELGGHSLLAMRLVTLVRKAFNTEVAIKTIFTHPTIATFAGYLQTEAKGELLPSILPLTGTEPIPLSFSQERLWFIHQLEGSLQYHLPAVFNLRGQLNKAALEYALQTVIERHSVLRSVIYETPEQAFQKVLPANGWQLELLDGTVNKDDHEASRDLVGKLISQPFDLLTDYMLRATLINLDANEHVLVVIMHHIASDGWSLPLIVKELVELYSSFVENRLPSLAVLPVQYSDFAAWQRNYLQGLVLDKKIAYWQGKLAGVEPLQLPADFSRPLVQSTRGISVGFTISQATTEAIQQLGRQQGATLFMTMLAAFKLLMHRYTQQQDICVGTPIAGRQQEETENLIGFFVNTLALRTTVDSDTSFVNLLTAVKQTTLDAYGHQEVPFEKVVETVVRDRDLGRTALFQVMFVLQNTPGIPAIDLPHLQLSGEAMENATAKFDLSFYIAESSNGLQCSVEYCTDLFQPATIDRMIRHYKNLLEAIVQSPDQQVGRLPMIDNQEQAVLMNLFSGKQTNYSIDKTLIDLVEEQVQRTPQSIALIDGDVRVSFIELDERANQFARHLLGLNVKAGDLVPVCMDRNIAMVVGILGLLKTGATYVPIDAAYPTERISYMLEDIAATMLVTNQEFAANFANKENVRLVFADDEAIAALPSTRPSRNITPGQAACIIYTSGSSGRPKGVRLPHEGLVNRLNWMWETYPYGPDEVNAIKTSIGFGDHICELFSPLSRGIPSVIFNRETLLDLDQLIDRLASEKITRWVLVPSLLRTLLNKLQEDNITLPHLKYWSSSGEALPAELVNDFYALLPASNHTLLNIYGSSEVSADVSWFDTGITKAATPEDSIQAVPIGRPLSNTTLYLLDKYQQPVPQGLTGEICVAGIQVASGYLNLPELTAQRFVPDPFTNRAGATMFRTGDYGRILPDGNIVYLGRIDDQVKIRGNRVELGEIETVLRQSGLVKDCVVVPKMDVSGSNNLVGYIVADDAINKTELSNSLKEQLPDYMVPAIWIQLDRLPLTASGKVNKLALPDPGQHAQLAKAYVAPGSELEEKLVQVWQQLLKRERIGVHDSFFELGGHSLLAMRVVSATRKELAVELSIKDIFVHTTVAALAAHLQQQSGQLVLPAIDVLPRPANIPLSFSQERLWFIDRLEGSTQYHIPVVLRLNGKLDKKALVDTLQAVVDRHEVLRTVLQEDNGQAYQLILEEGQWQLQLVTDPVYSSDPAAVETFIDQMVRAPFNLSIDHPVRAALVQVGEDENILVVNMHHIASDAWSISIIVKEVIELYNAFVEGRVAELVALPLQYADYSIWQRNYLQGAVLDKHIQYWKHKLEGLAPLQMPVDFARPAIRGSRGAGVPFRFDKKLSGRLQTLSQQQGVSLFMVMLAAFKVLLHRYSGQQDISVGTSIASRQQKELEGLIGFFVNTLALRDEVDPSGSFLQLLQQVKFTTLEAYAHQELPFEKVVEAVVTERDMSRSPLFQVMLVMQNTPEASRLALGEVALSAEPVITNISKFDITCFINESSEGLLGRIEYSTDLYREDTIRKMISHFENLLEAVVNDPQQQVGVMPMLAKTETQLLLEGFNEAEVSYPKDKNVIGLFEEQAAATPAQTALVFETETISYQELNERANQLAHVLISRGIKLGDLVPLYMERSADMIIAILGIMKAGAAYVPIDTDFPPERIRYMLEDTRAAVVVSSRQISAAIITKTSAEIIILEETSQQPVSNALGLLSANDLAYLIYTSGSTGRPKGVMIEHRSLLDYYFGIKKYTGIGQCKSFALVSTIATDLGNTVIYASLLSGGALHVFSKESVSNIEYLHAYFDDHRIDCLKIVPSHWKALSNDGELLTPKKLLVFGGEVLPTAMVEDILSSGHSCAVVNHYGPTETTIGKLLHLVKPGADYHATIPIGKPFSNTKVYVLTPALQLCPAGVEGQLYISGDGVARGYFNNPELTVEKFIKDPFSKVPATKMYGTGDLVKWLPDGNIEFIGRVDDQVKIRGYRIELGEIETMLRQSPLVSQAVVLAREDKQGNKTLVGYIVPVAGFDSEAILSGLREKLPDYMIPPVLIPLEQLPLTANGKVDRKALPDPEIVASTGDRYTAPSNETEARLTAIWQHILEVEQVGIHDDFFELGGHSLLAVRLVSAIRKAFAVEMPIGDIFDYPTVAQLAIQLGSQAGSVVLPVIEKYIPRPDHIPLSFSQERLWFIDQLGGSLQYHVPAVLKLSGNVNKAALAHALKNVVDRHEVLRTVYTEEDGQPYQRILDAADWQLQLIDIASIPNRQAGLYKYVQQMIRQPFYLSQDYMLRAALISLDENEHLLVVTLHHIASDGWSRSVLVNDFAAFYRSYEKGGNIGLQPLSVQYADYAIWQRNYLQGELLEKKISYWVQQLQGVPALQLPADFPRPAVQTNRGAAKGFLIEKDLADRLQMLSQQQGATLFMTLLSAFKILLYRYSGQQDICVGTPIAGRQQQEVESLIGFFVNTLALRTNLNGDASFIDLLKDVRAITLDAYANQEVPFEKVVEAVVKERDMSRSPLFQVMFVLRNTPEVPELVMEDVQLSRAAYEHSTALFDITMFVTEQERGLQVAIEYKTDLFTEATILRLGGYYKQLLQAIAAEPQQAVGILPILSENEGKQLLVGFNETTAVYKQDETIVSLFETQVNKTPGNIAVVFEDRQLTYRELDERSNQLAAYLQARGVREEVLVPVCLDRSLEMIISLLAILKAGGAYVPIDPEYPADRIRYMLQDIAASIILTDSRSIASLAFAAGEIDIVNVDAEWTLINQQPTIRLTTQPAGHHLAYVIYTSGSTGKPKGVMNEHAAVVNRLQWGQEQFQLTTGDAVLQKTTFCFDVSVWELFWPLQSGAKLVLAKPGGHKDPAYLKNLIEEQQVTISHFVPSMLGVFLADLQPGDCPGLQKIMCSGEALKPSQVALFMEKLPGTALHNLYGPTEAAIEVTHWYLDDTAQAPSIIPIGKPIANTAVYLLDKSGGLAPLGGVGEINISGVQVARGYLNLPGLTVEKFIADPFKPGIRMYRTGDLGRWLPDGNIEYLGRIDEQVKISGFRIELGEIETVLEQHASVQQAVVLAKEDKELNKRLVAYILPAGSFEKEQVISYLKERLPAYMVPVIWVTMETLPLMSNGKINRQLLPDPDISSLLKDNYIAPATATESALVAIWQELLGVERVGVNDNFFALGGHSLMIIKLVSIIKRQFSLLIPIPVIFRFPTIGELAGYLDWENNAEKETEEDDDASTFELINL